MACSEKQATGKSVCFGPKVAQHSPRHAWLDLSSKLRPCHTSRIPYPNSLPRPKFAPGCSYLKDLIGAKSQLKKLDLNSDDGTCDAVEAVHGTLGVA